MKTPIQNSKTSMLQYVIPTWSRLRIICNPYGLVRLELQALAQQQEFGFMAPKIESPPPTPPNEISDQLTSQISEYLAGQRQQLDVPHLGFLLYGIQKDVLTAVRNIPYGQTISYAQLARRIHQPDAVKKVRDIVRKNPLPLLYPCHRVVKDMSDIGSYVSERQIKCRLIKLENMSRFKTAGESAAP